VRADLENLQKELAAMKGAMKGDAARTEGSLSGLWDRVRLYSERLENNEDLTKKQKQEILQSLKVSKMEILQHVERVEQQNKEVLQTVRTDMRALKGNTVKNMRRNVSALSVIVERKIKQDHVDPLRKEVRALSNAQKSDPAKYLRNEVQDLKNEVRENQNAIENISTKTKFQETAIRDHGDILREQGATLNEMNENTQNQLDSLTDATLVLNNQIGRNVQRIDTNTEKINSNAESIDRVQMEFEQFKDTSLNYFARSMKRGEMIDNRLWMMFQQIENTKKECKSIKEMSIDNIYKTNFQDWTANEVCFVFSDPSNPGVSNQLAEYAELLRKQDLDGDYLNEYAKDCDMWKCENTILVPQVQRLKIKRHLEKFIAYLDCLQDMRDDHDSRKYSTNSWLFNSGLSDSGDTDMAPNRNKRRTLSLSAPKAAPPEEKPPPTITNIAIHLDNQNNTKQIQQHLSADDFDEP